MSHHSKCFVSILSHNYQQGPELQVFNSHYTDEEPKEKLKILTWVIQLEREQIQAYKFLSPQSTALYGQLFKWKKMPM